LKLKNKIYISINGIGYGHSSRILPLIFRLINDNNQIYISTYNEGYIFLNNYFKNIFKTYGIKYLFDEDGKLSFKKTLRKGLLRFIIILPLHLFLELRNLIVIKPDLVIVDSRFSTTIASYILKKNCILITNQLYVEIPRISPMSRMTKFLKRFAERIFFELWFWSCSRAKLILIPDFEPPYTIASKTIALRSIRDLDKIRFIGPMVSNYNSNFKSYNGEYISILLSGSLEERLIIIKRLLYIIKDIKENELEFKIFTGLKNFRTRKLGNIEIYSWVEEVELEKLMANSNLVILTGGHSSIMKCLQMEKPILFIVPTAHTEKIKNAIKLYNFGCAELIYLDKMDKKIFKENIYKIIHNYEKYKNNIIKFINYNKNINGFDYIINLIYEK